ncbi:hypothetical protein A3I40_00205 [Candidatus Uhrbacteria bacterium RIFCSPLOWO2_02_FULL_48_12]|uniref:CYTH domain-containing protein n=1 Tax=Candidatus Uhrbacteria bacterium RIFCSPLOWO2_02_FULL_48_12 TaxID=1802407 RepID=A0A1F7V7W5_9BACT|nr:MAG: hypothetical protein A3I40_00205 [Candidatus Uhrbacteria bacterium RIFCSPLOWO2_02_FULL_48_12]
METEIEAKFLDINPAVLRDRLRNIGAIQEYQERMMKRKTFDDQGDRLKKIGGWIRVRDEGDKITLSYKQLNDRTLYGTKEITVTVNNFDAASLLLEAVGFRQKSYQETKREKWTWYGAEITIDTWPWIPTFVEIEAPDEQSLKNIATKLGFDWAKALFGSVETAYQKYYEVTEEEIDGWVSITFSPVPDWLEIKRRL